MKVKVDYSEILNTDDLLITCHPDHTNIDENLKFINNCKESSFHSLKDHKCKMIFYSSRVYIVFELRIWF